MGSVDKDIGTVRTKHAVVGDLIQGCGIGGSSICARDVGDEPLHDPGSGGLPE